MRHTNLDAGESVFFSRELEQVKARSYDRLYPQLMARQLFPLDSTTDSGASTVTYESWDHVGMAKIISNYAEDLPNVEVNAKEETRKIYSEGVAFSYSIQDIRAASMAGKPLKQKQADAARYQLLLLEDKIAFDGDSRTDIPSFLLNPNFNEVTPVDGVDGTTDWESKTSDEILKDVSNMSATIRDTTNGVEAPNTLVLPEKQFALITTLARSSTSDTTIADFIIKSNPWVTDIIACYRLKDAAPVDSEYDSEDMALLYDRSSDKLWLETPQDVEMFEEQPKGLAFEIPCHMRTAGVICPYPKSVATLYGI